MTEALPVKLGNRGSLLVSDGLSVNGSELVRGLNSVMPESVVVTGGLAGDGDLTADTLTETSYRSKPPVLLVEDHEVNRRVAARMLERSGCVVDLAGNGLEALAALKATPYPLVFMACQMPVMDGFEAVRCLRREEAETGRHVPVIALTANAMPGDVERCRAAEMDDALAKPARLQDLRRTLERWRTVKSGG